MAFLRCGRPDPFTNRVRTLYRANVIRAPRAGIDPLIVLAVQKRQIAILGGLAGLLAGDGLEPPPVTRYAAADLSGLRSASLDLTVGLKLTAAFLAALGLPVPGGEISGSLWTGASQLDFEVRDVSELRVDIGLLGRAMARRVIDDNAATGIFFSRDAAARMLIITRTLVSRQFAVRATAHGGQSAAVSVDAIENLIGKSTASVAWNRESADTISFQGESDVAFAFGAVPCAIQPDRSIVFGVEVSDLTFGQPKAPPEVKPVIDEDGLLDFDDEQDAS
jgi:hypothetical protein